MSIKRKYRSLFSLIISLVFILTLLPISAFAEDEIDPLTVRDEFANNYLANYITTIHNADNGNFLFNEANTVLQSKDGYLWFGSYGGLTRYDGNKFNVWDAVSENGPKSSNIRVTLEDENGVIWIGTNDKGLVKYKDGTFTSIAKPDDITTNTVRDITDAPDGKIYCGTPDGIIVCDADGEVDSLPLDLSVTPFVIALCSDSLGNIYFVLDSGELYVYTTDGKTIQYKTDLLFYSIKSTSKDEIIAGSQSNEVVFMKFDGTSFTDEKIKNTVLNNITGAYEDENGFIWVCANGIGFFDTSYNYHNVGNLGGFGFFTDICGDYENGYWFTSSSGGAVHLSVGAFTNINNLYGNETGTVNAVVKHNGKLYIGTNSSLVIWDENGKPCDTEFSSTVTSRVRGIFVDSNDFIWICTYADNGVIRYNSKTGEYKSWLGVDGLTSEKTRCFAELQNGVICIGTGSGVTFIKGDEIITPNAAFDTNAALDLPDIMILSMAVANDGTLYIGTDGGGVYSVNNQGSAKFTEDDGLSGGVVLRLHANKKTNGVFAATSLGLNYIENNTAAEITKLPPFSYFDIMYVGDELMLLTSSMIIRTHADSLIYPDVPCEYTYVDKSYGLNSSINANSWNWIDENNNFYFCCDNGINMYSLNDTAMHFIPYAGVAQIDVDGVDITNLTQTITIPKNATRVTFDISYLSYGLISDAKLYYMLIGQDDTETVIDRNSGENLEVSYTNLKGGSYTLHVYTADSNGNIGNELNIQLQKDKKIYEYLWVQIVFPLLAVLTVVVGIILIVQYKNRKLHKKQKEYRTIISEALTAISNTIDAKDAYTSGHSSRVALYSVEIAMRMGMSHDELENLYYIGLLHDVGKIGVSNEILNKPSHLTDNEYEQVKKHVFIGRDILKNITTIKNLTLGAAEHHERWDGNGYSQGLSGEQISLEGRIIAVADSYDAMSSDRAYRKALSKEIILEEFRRFKAKQFDPEIADIAISMIEHDEFGTVSINEIIGLNEKITVKSNVYHDNTASV